MSIDGFCQHGKCKNRVQSEIQSNPAGLDGIERRPLHLCNEDASYFLSIRDRDEPDLKRIRGFVETCHKD